MRRILVLHVLLLLLASTEFTVLTAGLGGEPWRWCYFKVASSNGFGYPYVSAFTLPVVAAYLVAFAAGLIGFTLALKQGRWIVGTVGVLLSLLGLVSFAMEGSHWFLDHHRSWLAFSPAAMFVLTLLALRPGKLGTPARST